MLFALLRLPWRVEKSEENISGILSFFVFLWSQTFESNSMNNPRTPLIFCPSRGPCACFPFHLPSIWFLINSFVCPFHVKFSLIPPECSDHLSSLKKWLPILTEPLLQSLSTNSKQNSEGSMASAFFFFLLTCSSSWFWDSRWLEFPARVSSIVLLSLCLFLGFSLDMGLFWLATTQSCSRRSSSKSQASPPFFLIFQRKETDSGPEWFWFSSLGWLWLSYSKKTTTFPGDSCPLGVAIWSIWSTSSGWWPRWWK